MFEWLIASSLQFVIFGSVKNDVYKTFAQSNNGDAENHPEECSLNNLVPNYRFQAHNLVFSMLYKIDEICVFSRYMIRENFN